VAADRKHGLRAKARVGGVIERKTLNDDSSEECKLVLVVRTDLGMTKGSWLLLHMHAAC
jgi:PTH2 family peptidyl-tRNA hydrolase